jgi:hypothetical protein
LGCGSPLPEASEGLKSPSPVPKTTSKARYSGALTSKPEAQQKAADTDFDNPLKKEETDVSSDVTENEHNSNSPKATLFDEEVSNWFKAKGASAPGWLKRGAFHCKELELWMGDALWCATAEDMAFKWAYSLLESDYILYVKNKRAKKLFSIPTSILLMDVDSPRPDRKMECSKCQSRSVFLKFHVDNPTKTITVRAPCPDCGCPGRIPDYLKELSEEEALEYNPKRGY